jgi:hypothetical protein
MHVTGPSLWIAPLATGHPHGLPETKRPDSPAKKIQPVKKGRASDATAQHDYAEQEEHSADPPPQDPVDQEFSDSPSLMQQEICHMLEEQAEDAAEASDPDAPAPPKLTAYEETASLSRKSVFKTLP